MADAMRRPRRKRPPMCPRTASERRMTIGKPQHAARASDMPKKAAIAHSGHSVDVHDEEE